MGRPLTLLAHLKKIIVEVKSEENCLAQALLIAIANVDYDANYKSFRQGWKIRSVVQTLLFVTDIDLTNGVGIPELFRFGTIRVYQGLGYGDIMFESQVDSSKHFNLLFYDVEKHYHVITKLTGSMEKSTSVRHATKVVGVK